MYGWWQCRDHGSFRPRVGHRLELKRDHGGCPMMAIPAISSKSTITPGGSGQRFRKMIWPWRLFRYVWKKFLCAVIKSTYIEDLWKPLARILGSSLYAMYVLKPSAVCLNCLYIHPNYRGLIKAIQICYNVPLGFWSCQLVRWSLDLLLDSHNIFVSMMHLLIFNITFFLFLKKLRLLDYYPNIFLPIMHVSTHSFHL